MTSPAEELAATYSPQIAPPPCPEPDALEAASGYGPDEERLVQRARDEAMLRLARAL